MSGGGTGSLVAPGRPQRQPVAYRRGSFLLKQGSLDLLKRLDEKKEKKDSEDKNFENSEQILLVEKKTISWTKHFWRITVDCQ